MTKKQLVALVAIVVAVLVVRNYLPQTPAQNDAREVYDVSAAELFDDYEKNAIAADARVKGTILMISGKVKDIGKDISGVPYLVLGSNMDTSRGVQAMLDDSSGAAQLSKGDTARVRCTRSDGHVVLNVIVRGCSLSFR